MGTVITRAELNRRAEHAKRMREYWRKRRENGTLASNPNGNGHVSALRDMVREEIRAAIRDEVRAALAEITK